MPTPTIATKILNVIRTKLSGTNVDVRISGKSINGVLAAPSVTERTSMYGAEEGYVGSLYVLVAELPPQGIEDGQRVELKEVGSNKWISRKIMSIETKSQVVKRLSLEGARL